MISLHRFAYSTIAKLPCRVQNLVSIWSTEFKRKPVRTSQHGYSSVIGESGDYTDARKNIGTYVMGYWSIDPLINHGINESKQSMCQFQYEDRLAQCRDFHYIVNRSWDLYWKGDIFILRRTLE